MSSHFISESKCNTSDSSSQCTDVHAVGLSLKALSLGIIFIVSMAMNGTICLVFYKKSQLLTVSNTFVLNLICCQLAVCIAVLPFTLTSVFSSRWIFNDVWCQVEGFILTICVVSTQISLTIIAIDRNYAIINSLRYPNVFTKKRCNIVIGISWAISVVLAIPPLAGRGAYSYSEDQNTCIISWRYSIPYSITFLTAGFVFPLLIQSWCYLTIFKAAMNHVKRSNRIFPSISVTTSGKDIASTSSESSDGTTQGGPIRSYKSMEWKAMRTILLIACSYAVCWVPYLVFAVNEICNKTNSYNLGSLTIVMLFLNSSMDPLIYAFMNRIMRFEIYKFYCDSISKISGNTSTYNDSDDYISSTNVSTSQSTSRTKRNNSMKSRYGKNSAPARGIEMNTIEEESEIKDTCMSHEQRNPKVSNREIVLTPVELLTKNKVSKIHSLPSRLKTTVNVHTENQPPDYVSRNSDKKPRRSQSEIWTRKEKRLNLEKESFLFFDLDGAKKESKRRRYLTSNIKKKRDDQRPTETWIEQTTLTSSTTVHNEHNADLDIITKLSVGIKRTGKQKNPLSNSSDDQTRPKD